MEKSEEEILRQVQRQAFPEEIRVLEANPRKSVIEARVNQRRTREVKKSSSISRLDPFISNGLLRVGGRLSKASLSEDTKHQIILPRKNHVTNLIIEHCHILSGHSGRQYVLALLRRKYWVIKANSTVRNVLKDCLECRTRQAMSCQQKMADLPIDRITADRPPFTAVGVDYFGLFHVKRGRSLVKRYGAIFICLAVRAVHIEIAQSLDTDSFLLALRRFIARRGEVKEIRSDNGTNFTSGNKKLREAIEQWNQEKIHDYLLQNQIKWTFNPPLGSHFGGVWERSIRTTKKILKAVTKEQSLDEESLRRFMCEVEAIINGRPITPVSDPNDLDVLTPNRILLLRSDNSLPPGTFRKEDCYSRRRWRQVQYLADIFWKRWIREYLPLLQERQKWTKIKRNVSVGDVVLVRDETSPRNSWPLGRVLEVFPDSKGLVRRVKLKTTSAVLERPVDKLCLLVESPSDV